MGREHLSERLLQHFAIWVSGELVNKHKSPRDFVGGELIDAMGSEIGPVERRAGGHDEGDRHLFEHGIRRPDDRGLRDARVPVEGLLDLFGVDFLARSNDEILAAAEQGDVAGLVDAREIARPEPPVRGEAPPGGLGVVGVPVHNEIAADAELARDG
jgi:hypothetical protein